MNFLNIDRLPNCLDHAFIRHRLDPKLNPFVSAGSSAKPAG